MNKYCKITLDGAGDLVEVFSAKDIATVWINAADDVEILYNGGSKIEIASASALVQADADAVFQVIKDLQQSRWSDVAASIPLLSQTVNAFTFTF